VESFVNVIGRRGRQTEGRFVGQQQSRLRGDRAGNGDEPLLSARKLSGSNAPSFPERAESFER
jgi:hypothetical protein